jgi:hypothetical protein
MRTLALTIAAMFCACSDSGNKRALPGSPAPGHDASGSDNSDAAVPADSASPPDLADPAGPWPKAALTLYGAADGLDGEIIDASPDDAQNIWAVSTDALYVLRPGQTRFLKFTAADGLHIQPFTDPNGNPSVTNITAVAGGHANEVFVGYHGYESEHRFADTTDEEKLGQADKITLSPTGTIQVLKYEFRCDKASWTCWENRSVRRMLFAHTGVAAGHLFIGFDHGVSHVFNDTFGDHIHVEIFWHDAAGNASMKLGEQYGLAVLPTGDLVTGSGYGVGLQQWNADPKAWVDGPFLWAFTTYGPAEPYNGNLPYSLDVPWNYREDQRGAAVSPDGTIWLASLRGLASYNPNVAKGDFSQIKNWTSTPGLPSSSLQDVAADPDGTVWIVDGDGRLLRLDPAANSAPVWAGVSDVRRVVMDTTVVPRALYVSVGGGGLAVVRAK